MHIPPYLQEILLPHTLMRKPTILGKVLAEVTTIQNLCQQQPPTLLIHRQNHLILRQSKHLMKHTHHRPLRTSTIQDASVLSVPHLLARPGEPYSSKAIVPRIFRGDLGALSDTFFSTLFSINFIKSKSTFRRFNIRLASSSDILVLGSRCVSSISKAFRIALNACSPIFFP